MTIRMDGRWDIDDLSEFAEGLEGIYGYFCAVFIDDDILRRRIDDLVQTQFWNRDFEHSYVGERVYQMLPAEAGLRIKSIRYASPGAIEIVGILGVLLLLAKVVKEWTGALAGIVETYDKIHAFFEKHRHLRRPPRNFNLGQVSGAEVDEARTLMFELGHQMGLDDTLCNRVLEMAGNPVSGLKFMAALTLQARTVARLGARGLLELPSQAVKETPSGPMETRDVRD